MGKFLSNLFSRFKKNKRSFDVTLSQKKPEEDKYLENIKNFRKLLNSMNDRNFSNDMIYSRYLRHLLKLTNAYCGFIGLRCNVKDDDFNPIRVLKILVTSYEEEIMRISYGNSGTTEKSIYNRLYDIFDCVTDCIDESITTAKIKTELNKEGFYLIFPLSFKKKKIVIVLRSKEDFINISYIIKIIDDSTTVLKEFIEEAETNKEGVLTNNIQNATDFFVETERKQDAFMIDSTIKHDIREILKPNDFIIIENKEKKELYKNCIIIY